MYYLASNATHRFAYNSVTKAVDVKKSGHDKIIYRICGRYLLGTTTINYLKA